MARSRARRWATRLVLVIGGLVVVAVAAVVIAVHTDYGREVIRSQVEAQLERSFVGGGRVGAIEGSVLRDFRLRDIVIDGPDGAPAITIGRLTVDVGLRGLLGRHAHLERLIAEDVDVILRRDEQGELQIAQLLRQREDTGGPGWSVSLPSIEVRRGHVAIETAEGVHHLDDVAIHGAANVTATGATDADLTATGTWRERAAGLALDVVLRARPDTGTLRVPSLIARLGDVTLIGSGLEVDARDDDRATRVSGVVRVRAPAASVTQLAPSIALPADVAITATATPKPPWTDLVVQGTVGSAPVTALVSANLDERRARGVIASGTLDLALVSGGRLDGEGGALVAFDGSLEPPRASGVAHVWGTVAGAPEARAAIAFSASEERGALVAGLAAPSLEATLSAQLERRDDALVLERANVSASTTSPERASGGHAPVRGALDAKLAAHGVLHPEPSLAITGTIRGRDLHASGASAARLALAIDATRLPHQPLGRAELELEDLVYDGRALGELEIDAANRRDGRIQVAVRSRPKQAPWLIELDALVTPPGDGEIVTVDVQRHHVRAGSGGDWYGSSGRLEIGPRRIVLDDLRSAGAQGQIAVEGALEHAGRGAGNVIARLEAQRFTLDNLGPAYRGTVNARVAVTRTNGRWAGDIELAGRGLAAEPSMVPIDAAASIHAKAGQLVVDARATGRELGTATLAADIDAPKDVTDLEAWRQRTRNVIRNGRLRLDRIDLARVAELAGGDLRLAGTIDGQLRFDAGEVSGQLRVRDLVVPELPGEDIDAELQIAQRGPGEITPTVTGTLGDLGRFDVVAQLAVPHRPFDPATWRQLGARSLHGATARLDDIQIEPSLLDQLGVSATLYGRARVRAELSEGLRSAQLAVDIADLRGEPLVRPIDVHLVVAVDGRAAHATAAIHANTAPLVELQGQIPISLAALRANPRAVLAAPLRATARLPWVPAPILASVFGHSVALGGLVDGTVTLGGTVGAPTLDAQIVGSNLKLPPGIDEPQLTTIERLAIDASWDGARGRVRVHGIQQFGRLELLATGSPRALDQASLAITARRFDLRPLLAFVPGPAAGSAGRLDADLRLRGLAPGAANVAGELHLTDARVPIAPEVGTLRRARIDVVVGARGMTVAIAGRLGRGDVRLAGRFALVGAIPTSGEATLTLRDVSPIGALEPVIDADVKARLRREGGRWLADVIVDDAKVVVPEDRGEKLDPVGAPADMVFATGEPFTERPGTPRPPSRPLLVATVTLRATEIESPEFRGIANGKLTVSADTESVGLVGSVNADRGDVDLFGQRYLVERAAVKFDGSTDPMLDIVIAREFPEVTSMTQIRGRLSEPELILSSDPAIYSQGQLLGFLLGGQPTGEPTTGSAREQLTGAGASILANRLTDIVRDALPIDLDVLRYEAETASSSAAITVGTWLTQSLFLAYRHHLEARPDENAGEAEVQYWISRRVMVEGSIGDRGYSGVDLLWRKRY